MFLGVATKAIGVPIPIMQGLVLGLSLYELFLLFFKRDEQNNSPIDVAQVIKQTLDNMAVGITVDGLQTSVFTITNNSRSTRDLDFDAMNVMYEKYGERGVYAYLVENGIARDRYHGEFIIHDLFLPEREKDKDRIVTEPEVCTSI